MLPSRMLDWLDRQLKWLILFGAALASGLVGAVDYYYGEPGSLWLLHLPVVMTLAWRFGMRAASVFAIAILLSWLLANESAANSVQLSADNWWETVSRFAALMLSASLTVGIRNSRVQQKKSADTDALTGLRNWKSFLQCAEAELNRGRRANRPVTLAFLDCDRFKQINDTLGHLVGDELLKTVASTLKSGTRNYDIAARWAGDEFVLLLPDTDEQAARVVVERVRDQLSSAMKQHEWPVTFSIGVITCRALPESATEMIREADQLMYEVKRESRGAARFKTLDAE